MFSGDCLSHQMNGIMWERWQLLRTTTEGPLFKGEEGDWRGETEAHRTGLSWSTCSSSRRLVTVEPKAQEGPDGPREGVSYRIDGRSSRRLG